MNGAWVNINLSTVVWSLRIARQSATADDLLVRTTSFKNGYINVNRLHFVMSKNKKKCFVISQIREEDSDIRKRSDQIFTYVIEKAVTPFGYSTIRADKIPRPGIITSQIIDHLLKDK